ncbi:MAG: ester cyclase [Anaerolineales bacterium]|nr:ester cyclase [Anaerolineales bacterium]
MSEENKALARRILEDLVVALNLDNLEEYFTDDVVVHVPFLDLPPGREGLRVLYGSFPGAISDVVLTFEDQIAEGDQVVTRWSSEFTHTGDLFGVPATGKRVKQSGIMIYRIKGGKVVEQWAEANMMGLMQQLGVVPPPGG